MKSKMKLSYNSQYKQDEFIDKVLFGKKNNGFFIDIGAHDGISLSNSLFFEKHREWKGICVEPNPIVYKKLIRNRTSLNLNVCIGKANEIAKFTQIKGYSEMLSGMTTKYDERHLERINNEIKFYGGEISEIDVEMIRLDTIENINNTTIDFISIDTEGNEFDILKSIDFKMLNVIAIVVENNYQDKYLREYLFINKYVLLACLHTDEIYIHKKHYKLSIRYRLILWHAKKKTNYYLSRIIKKLK